MRRTNRAERREDEHDDGNDTASDIHDIVIARARADGESGAHGNLRSTDSLQ